MGSPKPVRSVPLKGWVTEGPEDSTIPQVRDIEIRSNSVSTTRYSLVVPLKIKGKTLDLETDLKKIKSDEA